MSDKVNGPTDGPRVIYGKINANWQGGSRASEEGMDSTLSRNVMSDMSFSSDVGISLDDIEAACDFDDKEDSEVFADAGAYSFDDASECGILHGNMRSLASDASNALAVYAEDNEIDDADDLDGAFDDETVTEDLDRAADEMMMSYGEDCADYVYASPDPVAEMSAVGEEYGYFASEDEIVETLSEHIRMDMYDQAPHVDTLDDLKSMMDSPRDFFPEGNLGRTFNASDRLSEFQETMIRSAASQTLDDYDSESDTEDDLAAKFDENFTAEMDEHLAQTDSVSMYREFMDRGLDPDLKVGDTNIKNLASMVAHQHCRNIAREYLSSAVYKLQNPKD